MYTKLNWNCFFSADKILLIMYNLLIFSHIQIQIWNNHLAMVCLFFKV